MMIKVTSEADQVCVAKANEAGQDHIFEGWDDLSPTAQRQLIEQVRSIDFQLVTRLTRQQLHGAGDDFERHVLKPPRVESLPTSPEDSPRYAELRRAGEEALAAGKVSLVMLSGGTGVGPLGEPTGLLPVGPVTGKSLFELNAEKIRAIGRRYRASLRLCIITHPDSDREIRALFKANSHFGLSSADVSFLPQPLLPLIDRRGKFLLTDPGLLALRPNGHGGVLLEFLKQESMEQIAASGVEHIFFFQADNPLVKIADPAFIGHHVLSGVEVSSKAIRKLEADEPVGVFCELNGTTGVVEYAMLREEDKRRTKPDGSLVFSSGNLAVHLFSVAFLERMVTERIQLPFHALPRKMPYVNKRGRRVNPTEPNAMEFCCYLFDCIRAAQRSSVLEVPREEEFSPIKSTGGPHSPQTAQRDLSRLYARWLRRAGAVFSATSDETLPVIEISPLYALDSEELKAKLELPFVVEGNVLLGKSDRRS